MKVMRRRKITKKEMDEALLQALFQAEKQWKQAESINKRSVDLSEYGYIQAKCARSKYLFLLREAKHRNVHALQY